MASKDLNVLVVGAGQIGSRHMQALANTPAVRAVTAVEPNALARETAVARWKDVPDHAGKTLDLVAGLDNVATVGSFDIAIIATSAPGRLDILRSIAGLGVRRVLSEKLLFQSVAELNSAVELCEQRDIVLYPNYVYRFVSPWSALKNRLDGKPFALRVDAGDIGLATNLPHWLDMFEYLAGRPAAKVDVKLTREPYASKRGGGIMELSGTVSARTANGETCMMTFDGPARSPVITVNANGEHGRLDENDSTISGELLEQQELQTPMVSRTTAIAVAQIMSGKTVLPTLFEVAESNRLMLQAIGEAMFGTHRDDRSVPVT